MRAYCPALMPVSHPAVPPRPSLLATSPIRTIHVAPSPTCIRPLECQTSGQLWARNSRSYNATIKGAVTIVSFVAIPTVHASTARTDHPDRRGDDAILITQYN